ncbi:UDP-N-acetylgalactosamine-undecaprenyl-phosphate N-acetylgalactosaminephosphotransferase [Grimontia celer]|uniref:UDP-N-acetylgalactosamine-undecaprenyl-phosphate N-acetylgalactosaminephosphotransferase n=1 Tax=Grimontia celer TaxID=1796497 RepID=A0A128F030_9GAMM|nr:sugar transferase [Grimontia celer]CZF80153.1 UDP-N-acetylgalactosamine-undecaprenyl-phosphate N-acetylgalactosaminephosphotransferase [Grimontia celer]
MVDHLELGYVTKMTLIAESATKKSIEDKTPVRVFVGVRSIVVYCSKGEEKELLSKLSLLSGMSWDINNYSLSPESLRSRVVCYWHPDKLDKNASSQLLAVVKAGGRVMPLVDHLESKYGFTHLSLVNEHYFLQHRCFYSVTRRSRRFIKRCLDIGIALLLLAFTWPLILLGMLLVGGTSGFPIIYKQERVGRYNKPFLIYKLRTMIKDSESNGLARWSSSDDDRVIRFGKILRATRIDELPQIYNILKGEMSFVGPRPERQQFIDLLQEHVPWYPFRHSVKPGLTGWAQIKYGYGSSIEDAMIKHQYDIYYLKNQSIGLDLKITLKTLRTVFQGLVSCLKK